MIVLKKIRKFAVKCLTKNQDSIEYIILQLTACLKYEPFKKKKSRLVIFLFEYVINNPTLTTKFYWALQVESSNSIVVVKNWYKKLITYFLEELNKQKGPSIAQLNHSIMLKEVLEQNYRTHIVGNKSLSSKEVS